MSVIKVAVLDDYQAFSKSLFSQLDSSKYQILYFPDTLPAYNREDTPATAKEALVQRLEPFHVICTQYTLK